MTQTIVRSRRRYRFVILDQRAVEDRRLSWAARGLLGYLLSRPDDWKVLVKDLQRRGDLGRDGIYKLLRELRNAGYVHFERVRDPHGRLRGGTYFVREEPEAPHPDLPDTAQPDEARPDTAKPDSLPKTDSDSTTTTTTRPTTTNTAGANHTGCPSILFPSWVPEDQQQSAGRIVAALSPPLRQLVVDEWVGSMAAGAVRRSRLGYLRALVVRLQHRDFFPKRGKAVASARCHLGR